MRTVAWILLGISILGSVLIGAARRFSDPAAFGTGLQPYVLLLVVATCGMVLLRLSFRRRTDAAPAEEDAEVVEAQLTRLVAHLQTINTNSETIEVHEICRVIDDDLAPDLNGCVASREALSRRWGLQSYADFMSRFVEGQRNIHLARQASSVGNLEEVWENLGSAEACMIEAYTLLKEYRTRSQHPSHN